MRLATLVLFAAAAAFAATPNFSGNWKLNPSKSEFGQFPPPSSMTQKVTQTDTKVTVESKQESEMGPMESTIACTLDGKESTSQGFGGEMKNTAKWDADALVIESKGSFGDQAFTMKDKWTLSGDGKTLTIQRHFTSGMGDMDQKMVLEKQ